MSLSHKMFLMETIPFQSPAFQLTVFGSLMKILMHKLKIRVAFAFCFSYLSDMLP